MSRDIIPHTKNLIDSLTVGTAEPFHFAHLLYPIEGSVSTVVENGKRVVGTIVYFHGWEPEELFPNLRKNEIDPARS